MGEGRRGETVVEGKLGGKYTGGKMDVVTLYDLTLLFNCVFHGDYKNKEKLNDWLKIKRS